MNATYKMYKYLNEKFIYKMFTSLLTYLSLLIYS